MRFVTSNAIDPRIIVRSAYQSRFNYNPTPNTIYHTLASRLTYRILYELAIRQNAHAADNLKRKKQIWVIDWLIEKLNSAFALNERE